jgi:hypothetical protein
MWNKKSRDAAQSIVPDVLTWLQQKLEYQQDGYKETDGAYTELLVTQVKNDHLSSISCLFHFLCVQCQETEKL